MKVHMIISSIRSMLPLAAMAIITVSMKNILRTTNSIFSFVEVHDRMLTSQQQNMIEDAIKRTTQPLLVLHVGPAAAGVASIESSLSKDLSEELLKSHQYKYIGNDAMKRSKSYRCNATITTGCTSVLSSDLIELLDKEDQNLVGSNVLLHDLDPSRRRAWEDATRNKRDTRIVVDYVRLHELLLSRYNQQYQRNDKKSDWPGIKGNDVTPSFSNYLANTADLEKHESVQAYDTWGQHFSVSLFNVYQEGDLATNFVCQEVKGAKGMCQQLTNEPDVREKRLSRSPMLLDYDIMAVSAYEQRLVHDFDSRQELAEAIREHHKKKKEDLPLKCPDKQTLDKLYTASKRFESWAVTVFGVSNPVTDFDESWNRALETNALCGVDAKAALDQDVWRSFFRLRYIRKSSQFYFRSK